MLFAAHLAVTVLVAALLVWTACYDWRHLKIRNTTVMVFVGLAVLLMALRGFATWQSDLAAGALLFVIGFGAWMLRAMGGGDAKLFLPLGLLLGMTALSPFSMFFLLSSVLMLVAIRWAGRRRRSNPVARRLRMMALTRQVPYAVPMAAATIPALFLRAFGLA
ncbi:prepilin peptidase [Litorisediminicola beolgyonensis]|uniref:Prepilin peptidase n=1 Tax=Litorisediminicola beolgyonensis TaxID=1173614 RepID=A0ABW3ZED7_9RHOB